MLDQSRVFGAELRRLRTSAGLTITQFASSVHYSKGQISKIETGHKQATSEFARLCDVALGADGDLAALVPPKRSPLGPPRPHDEPGATMRGKNDSEGNADPGDHALPTRRQVMAVSAASALGAVPFGGVSGPHGDLSGDLLTATCDLFQHYRRIGQLTPPATLLPILAEQTRASRGLATQCGPRTAQALIRLSARYAEFAGWMAQEAGDDTAANRWTDDAVAIAQEGEDHDLASYARVRRALISYYRGDAAEAIALSESVFTDRVPPRIRGLAAQQAGQGHALAGDYNACMRSLDRARTLLDADRPDPSMPILGPTHLPDPVTMITGWSMLDLGRPRQAAALLDRACAGLPAHAYRTQARYGVRRALAHAVNGEIDHACALVRPLLPAARSTDSATIRIDLRRLSRTLTRFRTHPAVAGLLPDLTSALHSLSI